MSAGYVLNREVTRILHASGLLVGMVVKKKISRELITASVSELRLAADVLESIIAPKAPPAA